MRHSLLQLLWLTWVGSALFAQTLSFPEGLTPFRLNRVEVDQVDWAHLRIWGERFDGSEVPLFSGPGIPRGDGFLYYVYLDEDIRFLGAESESSSGQTQQLTTEVRRTAFRVSVYGFPGQLEGATLWQGARSEDQLDPGDICVLSPEADPTPLIAAGVHVLTTGARSVAEPDSANPWRGYLLSVPDLEADTITATLETRREEIVAFKQRYQNLPVSLGFHGPLILRQEPLVFPDSTPVTIARSLQAESFRDRIGPQYRYALLAFSSIAIAAVALIRSWKILLPIIGILVAAFVIFSITVPLKLRSLTIEFALPVSREDSGGRPIHLEPVGDQQSGIFHYRQSNISPGSLRLVYRSLMAPGGEAGLRMFADDPWVRFNQIPEVQQRNGQLILKFRNPLSAWSLHEAQ